MFKPRSEDGEDVFADDHERDGGQKQARDLRGRRRHGLHYAMGRVTSIAGPKGATVHLQYDLNGNLRVLTNPFAVDHAFDYNRVNLKNLYQAPLSGSYSYTYDRDRRLQAVTFPRANRSATFTRTLSWPGLPPPKATWV